MTHDTPTLEENLPQAQPKTPVLALEQGHPTASAYGTASPKRPHLIYIHNFRALAIISIVLRHIWEVPVAVAERESHLISKISSVAFQSSTLYFLFISGFLFFYLSPKFTLRRYYRNKLLNVLLPFAIITSAAVIGRQIPTSDLSTLAASLQTHLIHGTAYTQFWYIPFISLVFLASPLLLKIPHRIYIALALAATILALFGSRWGTLFNGGDESFFNVGTYMYFAPAYLLGGAVALEPTRTKKRVRQYRYLLWLLVISGSLFLLDHENHSLMLGTLVNVPHTIFYIQKMGICLLVFSYGEQWLNFPSPTLNILAKFSFALYFTHLIPNDFGWLEYRDGLYQWVAEHLSPVMLFPTSAIVALLQLTGCLLACWGIHKVMGRYSRYIIGA